MLLILLALMSSTTFLVGAVSSASSQHVGLVGYLLATVIGLALATFNFWMVRRAGFLLAGLPHSGSERLEDRLGQAFCLIVLLWTGCAGFVGFWAASAALRLTAMK